MLTANDTAICACCKDHNEGVCECDCCCNCVVIGVIDTGPSDESKQADPKEPALTVDRTMVRKIRPVLTGYFFDCFMCGSKGYKGNDTGEQIG